MQLSKSIEYVMYLYKRKKAFLKELITDFPEPKPANTTVATLLKRKHNKGFISYTLFGKSRAYCSLIKNFFNDSASQFVFFFAKETKLTMEELI